MLLMPVRRLLHRLRTSPSDLTPESALACIQFLICHDIINHSEEKDVSEIIERLSNNDWRFAKDPGAV